MFRESGLLTSDNFFFSQKILACAGIIMLLASQSLTSLHILGGNGYPCKFPIDLASQPWCTDENFCACTHNSLFDVYLPLWLGGQFPAFATFEISTANFRVGGLQTWLFFPESMAFHFILYEWHWDTRVQNHLGGCRLWMRRRLVFVSGRMVRIGRAFKFREVWLSEENYFLDMLEADYSRITCIDQGRREFRSFHTSMRCVQGLRPRQIR